MTKKTAYLKIGIWFNEATEHIDISSRDGEGFISTVCNDPNSKRGNPNLYRKLAKILLEKGLSSPLPDVTR